MNIPHLQAAYNTSKAGVIHLCKLGLVFFWIDRCSADHLLQSGNSLAVEWVGFARANCVSPGYVESGLTGSASEEVKELLKAKTPMR